MVARYRGKKLRRLFRGDAAFARPEVNEFLRAEGFCYVIRMPVNERLQEEIFHLLTRPVGRPPSKPQVFYASFRYQAGSWTKPSRVVAKVDWHRRDLFPRVGFIVTNLRRSVRQVVRFYSQRGTAEQWIKEGKGARSAGRSFLPEVQGQHRPAPALCPRLQHGQLHAYARPT